MHQKLGMWKAYIDLTVEMLYKLAQLLSSFFINYCFGEPTFLPKYRKNQDQTY